MQVIWCLKFCNMTKSGGTIPPLQILGDLSLPSLPVIYAHVYKQNTAFGLTKRAAAVCMHSTDSKRWQTQACWKVEAFYYDLLMNIRSFTSKRRRVCHAHVRHLIRTSPTIDQVSICQAANGGGHAAPAQGWNATDSIQRAQNSRKPLARTNLVHV